ncbi:flagellar basal body protein [Caulobacter sp. NIBR2454]|uniref:flagellar basal body protein n=1 Tax=Caulobacter sp. NIBR2454 TaxID=3015996 RepID=UPI0022B691B3|nr:flagellar basal body protein [Caulobacter sp. NIBR2454]
MTANSDVVVRAEALVNLTQRLTELLAQQAQAFETRRPHEAADTIEESAKLANVYRFESARLKRDPSVMNGAPPALRAQLLRVTEAFDAVLARHGRALEAAKTITEGLVQAIAEEVASQRSATGGYGSSGERHAPADAGVAIALNRRA